MGSSRHPSVLVASPSSSCCCSLASSQQGLLRNVETARTDWQISSGTQTPCPLVITPKSPGPWLAVLQHCMTSLLGSILTSQPWWDFCENTRQTVKGKQREKYIHVISSVSKEPSIGGRCMERLAHKALGLEMRTRLRTHSPCPTCEECPIFFHQPLSTKVHPSGKWHNIHQALQIRRLMSPCSSFPGPKKLRSVNFTA